MGPNVGAGLQELLLSLLTPPMGVHGDAVYSQEALDRIITSLMEAIHNPTLHRQPHRPPLIVWRKRRSMTRCWEPKVKPSALFASMT